MSARLADILGGYLDLRWRLNPVEATAAGRHEHDGSLGRFDRGSVREMTAALRSYTTGLEEAEAGSLDEEIDRTAALHAARHDLLVLERERPFARDPSFHLLHAMCGIFLLLERNAQDPPLRAAALLERVRALPDFLDVAAEALTEPRAPLVETARAMLPAAIHLVRYGARQARADLSTLDPTALAGALDHGADALARFADVLALASEKAGDDVAIGRELFERKLHTAHMLQHGADDVLRYGMRLREEARGELERLAGEIDPAVPWQEVATRLRQDAPVGGAALAEYEQSMCAALDFAVERALVSVPEGELRVLPTPAFLRPLVPFAAYQGPGAYDADQRGAFYVTLPADAAARHAHCRAELPVVAVHEGVPGHHLQTLAANRLTPEVRRVLATPATREGWAVYCETLMAEEGFFESRAERFFQAHHLLWRALRVVLDVSLHAHGMSTQAAARVLREELGLDAASAEAEVRRYCAFPTYQVCYAMGRREILRLRADARSARGAGFSLREFHDELLSYGGLPIALARWGMGLV